MAQPQIAPLRELFFGRLEQVPWEELNQLWERLKSHSRRERERLWLASGQA